MNFGNMKNAFNKNINAAAQNPLAQKMGRTNPGSTFQAALGNARKRIGTFDSGDSFPSAASLSIPQTPSAPTSNTASSSGLGAPNGLGLSTSTRSNTLASRGVSSPAVGTIQSRTYDRAEQELRNELIQSGLQSQTVKSFPIGDADNSSVD